MAFSQYLAWLIVTERISPLDGAQRMERIHYWEEPEVWAIAHMSGLVDEWEGGWGRSRSDVDQDIMQTARELFGTASA